MPPISSRTCEKLHVCREGCGTSFVRKPDRDRHERVHRPYDEREFACSFEGCDFRANQSSGLKCHVSSVHEKARILCPFPGCNQHYSDPSSVTRHKKKHHPGGCPPDRPKRIAELPGSSSSSSRRTTMINSRSEVPHRSNGCCACHVKLESATSDSLGHSVLHTKSSSVMKTDFPSLCFPDATLQAFTPTFDLENQVLNAVPDFHMNHDIPTVSPLKSNHFVPHGPASSTNDLLLCKSVFDSNPSMSQYNTTSQTSRSVSNASHLTAMGSVLPPWSINAGNTAPSFAAVQPSYGTATFPNYDANFHHPGPSTNLSQLQGQHRINIPPLDFDYSSYSHWPTDAGSNTEGMSYF